MSPSNTHDWMAPHGAIHMPNAQHILPNQAMYSQLIQYWISQNRVDARQLQDQAQPISSLYSHEWSQPSIPAQFRLPLSQVHPPIFNPVGPYTVMPPEQAFQSHSYTQNMQRTINISPAYHANPNGTLVNIRHGSITVQPRGVHIRNLNHDANPKDVEEYFRSAGEIRDCQVRSSRKSKQCTAVVSFHSEQEAQLAVQRLDGTMFMGRRIEVKLDQDDGVVESSRSKLDCKAISQEEPTSPSRGPIIAHGDAVPELS